MKNIISIVCGVIFLAQCVNGFSAESGAISEEAREEFIKNFKRIGLNTTPGDAMMLRILVQASKAKRGVEVGTATGYGAINMGVGFERNGGHLYTIDIDPQMVKAARENIKKAGLENTVTVIEGDAIKVLPTLEGEFDFVFIDALKRDYLKYFQAISPKLKKGAIVVADNVIRSADEMRDFLEFMEKNKDYEKVIIRASMEKNDGMGIYLKVR
ncbi:MAG: O-methyltransferase [Limisphaerales bacterium]|jgi:predicted O-methyltransferase YrrM